MRRIRLCLVLSLAVILLTGCWGAREIEHLAYVNSIGLDYVNGKIVFYTQMISFNKIAKKEGGIGADRQIVSIGKGEGKSVDDAIFDLYNSTQQRLAWSHVKTLVFTEAALREDVIHQIIDEMDRYYEFRYTIWTMATRGSIQELFSVAPILNMSTLYSQLNNPTDRYSQSSIVAPLFLFKFIWKWKESGQTVLLPALTVNKDKWVEDGKIIPQLKQDGVCAIQSKKMKGCFKLDEIVGLRWLEKETVRTPLLLQRDQEPIAMMVLKKIKPSIEPKLSEGMLTFQIKVSAQGSITEQDQPATEEELVDLAETEIRKQIQKTYRTGLKTGTDLLGLSNSLYRSNPKEWLRLQEEEKLPLKSESLGEIDVKVELKDVGISKIMKKEGHEQ